MWTKIREVAEKDQQKKLLQKKVNKICEGTGKRSTQYYKMSAIENGRHNKFGTISCALSSTQSAPPSSTHQHGRASGIVDGTFPYWPRNDKKHSPWSQQYRLQTMWQSCWIITISTSKVVRMVLMNWNWKRPKLTRNDLKWQKISSLRKKTNEWRGKCCCTDPQPEWLCLEITKNILLRGRSTSCKLSGCHIGSSLFHL